MSVASVKPRMEALREKLLGLTLGMLEWREPESREHREDHVLHHVALENLLGSAFKYTRKQEQARIEFGSTGNGGGPVYFVRDNGVGFDMAYADKLFGAFQRLHGASEFPGSEIGLATVRRIVHRHGGRELAERAAVPGNRSIHSLPPVTAPPVPAAACQCPVAALQ